MRIPHWALVVAILLGACGPKAEEISAPPAWRTDDGRRGVWSDLARWYIDNNMPQQALDMVQRLRSEGVDAPELQLIQGESLIAMGIEDEARYVLEDLADRMPRDPRPLEQLGIIYADAGEHDLAIETFEKALHFDPTDPATRNNLGFLLFAQGQCEPAIGHFEKVLASDALNPRYRNNLAFALVCVGDHKRALKLFRSTADEADARYNMGVAYERMDSLPSAVLQYQQALKAKPEHEGAREAMLRLQPLGLLPDAQLTDGVPQ